MSYRKLGRSSKPLYTSQYRSDIVGRAPPVLENIQTELAGGVDIGMEHLADKFHPGRFIRILFLEMHHKPEGTILKGCVHWPNDHSIPIRV